MGDLWNVQRVAQWYALLCGQNLDRIEMILTLCMLLQCQLLRKPFLPQDRSHQTMASLDRNFHKLCHFKRFINCLITNYLKEKPTNLKDQNVVLLTSPQTHENWPETQVYLIDTSCKILVNQ